MTIRNATGILLLAGSMVIAGCAGNNEGENLGADTTAIDMEPMEEVTATVNLEPTEGNDVRGMLTITSMEGGVHVTGTISGLTEGEHGIHVHENGDCSAPDASSAGGHFAPEGSPHGAPTDPSDQRHTGDWGNIQADASGTVNVDLMDMVASLEGPNSIAGKAVVVHSGRDDLETQPSGDSGSRVACGVIMGGGMNDGAVMDTMQNM